MSRRVREPNTTNKLELKHDVEANYSDFNGLRLYSFTTALVDGVTVTAAPEGSFARTTHGTGKGILFVATGGLWEASGGVAASPDTYSAVLSQAGVAAPTAVVRENGLSGPIVWARSGVGVYTGTLVGAFLVNKVTILATLGVGSTGMIAKASRTSDDVITIHTLDAAGVAVDLVGDLHIQVVTIP